MDGGAGGMYSVRNMTTVDARYRKFRNDPQLNSLREEAALLKAFLAETLDSPTIFKIVRCPGCHKKLRVGFSNPLKVSELLESVRSMVLALNQIEKGFQFYIHVDELKLIVQQITNIASRFIPNEENVRNAFAEELRKLCTPSHS